MEKAVNKCMGCTKRYPGCHDKCDLYIKWKHAHDEEMKLIRRKKYNL